MQELCPEISETEISEDQKDVLRDAEAAVILTGHSAYFNRGPESPEVLINLISAAIASNLFFKKCSFEKNPKLSGFAFSRRNLCAYVYSIKNPIKKEYSPAYPGTSNPAEIKNTLKFEGVNNLKGINVTIRLT